MRRACAPAMQGDSRKARRLCLRKTRFLVFHNILLTDKMAEKKINFGRKWQTKYLHISKNSSTFVA